MSQLIYISEWGVINLEHVVYARRKGQNTLRVVYLIGQQVFSCNLTLDASVDIERLLERMVEVSRAAGGISARFERAWLNLRYAAYVVYHQQHPVHGPHIEVLSSVQGETGPLRIRLRFQSARVGQVSVTKMKEVFGRLTATANRQGE